MLRFLLPARCPICDTYLKNEGLCQECRAGLFPVQNACVRCAQPMGDFSTAEFCLDCLSQPPAFERVWIPWQFSGVLQDLIVRIKTGRNPQYLRPLALEFERWIALQDVPVASWTVIPMHVNDLRKRGFSVPSLVGRFCDVRVHHVITKHRETEKQATLGRQARASNLKDAFSSRSVSGDWIVLDDVVTTGATLNAAAQALKHAGAERVFGVALARTP